jgi:hypothetical protein
MGKRLWLLPVLLIPVLIVASFPASVVTSRLDLPLNLTQVHGSVWSGGASWQQPGWQPLDLSWRWRGGRLWHWQADGGITQLEGQWQMGPTVTLPSLQGELSIDRLDLVHWLGVARPTGTLELALSDVKLSGSSVRHAAGRAVWREAALVGAVQESLGDIEIAVQDHRPSADHGLELAVRSLLPAAVQVRGNIVLTQGRYQADLWLRAASGRGDLTSALAGLGELQPDGQVRVRVGGALGL